MDDLAIGGTFENEQKMLEGMTESEHVEAAHSPVRCRNYANES